LYVTFPCPGALRHHLNMWERGPPVGQVAGACGRRPRHQRDRTAPPASHALRGSQLDGATRSTVSDTRGSPSARRPSTCSPSATESSPRATTSRTGRRRSSSYEPH